ncbi:MAG: PilN domain-containing protein [Desulfovibrionales bacterium]|nr:PilN domain-containing protein [Desulfovibrionales bacterium]
MITINLQPQRQRARTIHVHTDAVVIAVVLFLLTSTLGGVHWYYSSQIAALQSEITAKTQIKNTLQERIGHINALLQEVETLQGKVKIIKDVRMRQGLPVRYIDELVVRIPANKLWVETFSLNANGLISLSGVALDNQSFAHFVETLRESKYVARVDTQRTSRHTIQGLGLVSFQCSVTTQEYFEQTETNGTMNNG